MNDQNIIIPIFGMLTGIIIPLAVFFWLYKESKDTTVADVVTEDDGLETGVSVGAHFYFN